MENHTSALIVAQPGRVRDGLRALLMAMSHIEAVDLVDDGSAALAMAAGYYPSLVLLDIPFANGEILALLKEIRSRWPQTQCIVLAEDSRQRQVARTAGADGVMLKGCPAFQFHAAVEKLLR